MKNVESIVIGDKVEIHKLGEKGSTYKTMIEDEYLGQVFQVVVPTRGMVPMEITRGDRLGLAFHRESGRYITEMLVIGIIKDRGMRYALLSQSTPTSRDQRRESYRLPLSVKIQVFDCLDETEENTEESGTHAGVIQQESSRDISATGIAFTSRKKYIPGDKYIIKLYLGGMSSSEPPLALKAKVVRVLREYNTNKYQVGMRFTDQTKSSNELLMKFVMMRQQEMIRQGKRV